VLRAIGGSANGMVHLRFDDHSPATVTGFRADRDRPTAAVPPIVASTTVFEVLRTLT